jgi:hypothetical protein
MEAPDGGGTVKVYVEGLLCQGPTNHSGGLTSKCPRYSINSDGYQNKSRWEKIYYL